MNNLILQPTILASWHHLVSEAEHEQALYLGEELESYLVFLLTRFTERTELTDRMLAIDFLKSLQARFEGRDQTLRDVGDECLLYAGFFHRHAEKKHLSLSYFVDLGQAAYSTLSDLEHSSFAELFRKLTLEFMTMVDILLVMRELGNELALLPHEAQALWEATGSQVAARLLARSSLIH